MAEEGRRGETKTRVGLPRLFAKSDASGTGPVVVVGWRLEFDYRGSCEQVRRQRSSLVFSGNVETEPRCNEATLRINCRQHPQSHRIRSRQSENSRSAVCRSISSRFPVTQFIIIIVIIIITYAWLN